MSQDSRGIVKEENLKNKLNGETGEGTTEVSDVGDEFEVLFTNSNRYYTVDKSGNVVGPNEFIEDKYPGDITKNKNGEDLDGTEANPYEICCIEDLVAFSNMANGEGIQLVDGKSTKIEKNTNFEGKYIILKRTLNFKSKYSYSNSERTDFGDINGISEDGNTLINEMTTGTGFKTIGITQPFNGFFDGKNNEIKNIYQNTTGYTGLFGVCANNTIKNIGLTGYMETTTDTYAGGLISYASHVTTVECINCHTDITIVANNASMVGGIIGRGGMNELESCYNLGNITANKGNAGGIIGYTITTNVNNCYNLGNIIGNSSGGIVGYSYYGTPLTILNSYNGGKIEGNNAGGIVGNQNGVNSIIKIENTYNTGSVTGTNVGGILNSNISIPTIENCWNAGELTGSKIEGGIIGQGGNGITQGKILNCFFLNMTNTACIYQLEINDSTAMTLEEMKTQNFVDLLNNYESEHSINWKKWKLGEKGFPIFQ